MVDIKKEGLKVGDAVPSCDDAPNVRVRNKKARYKPRKTSEGYSSSGHIAHFLPDREVNVNALTRALRDVYGEPGISVNKMVLEIDKDYWDKVCGDPWSGNIHNWSF